MVVTARVGTDKGTPVAGWGAGRHMGVRAE
jgi:hypothetical protein